MIQLKIRRTNSIIGTWKCEEGKFIHSNMIFTMEPMGVGKSIEDAIEDFLKCYKQTKGFTPDYKWS